MKSEVSVDLGKDITEQLKRKNQLNTHFLCWENIFRFLDSCKEKKIKKLCITGQTADVLQYKYLDELVNYLQDSGFLVEVISCLTENVHHQTDERRNRLFNIHS